jgi:cytoskeletal protein CcmA (bactofilin family)
MKQLKVPVACPKCGHSQPEPPTAYSTVCKKCRQYFRLEEVLNPNGTRPRPTPRVASPAPPAPPRETRRITCFDCGAELEVSPSAQSTMCKRCSSHMDLRDYQIRQAVSKNFRTKGRFVIEEGGYVFNSETFAGEAVIKGRFLGKLHAEHSLEIHRTAEIKGSFKTGKLVLPVGSTFRWAETLTPGSADIAGELIANITSPGTVILRPGARMFGDIEALHLVVESGAVVVGKLRVGQGIARQAAAIRLPGASPARVG